LKRRAYQLSGFMAVVIILVIVTFFAWRQAVREASIHHSLALAADAQQANQSGRMDLALALALEAVNQKNPPPEAVRAIRQIAAGPGTRAILVGHTMAAVSATISPDQTMALSGSCAEMDRQGNCQTGEIIVWDLATGSERTRWFIHNDWVTSIAFSQDGYTAISGSADGSIIQWDLATGDPLWQITSHSGEINSIAMSSNGDFILSGSEDGRLILWDTESGTKLRQFESDGQPVTSVVFGPGDQFAISATGTGKITLWKVESGQPIRELPGHLMRVNALAISPDGSKTLSTSEDLSLRLWSNEAGKVIHQENINCRPNKIALSQDGAFALVSCEHMFYRWDIQKWREQQRFIGHTDMINALAVSIDGRLGLSASSDGTLRLWNLGTQIEQEVFVSGVEGLNAIASTSDGENLLLGSDTPALWNIASRQIVRKYDGFKGYVAPGAVDISSDGRVLVIGGGLWPPLDVRSLVAWDVDTGEIVCNFTGHDTMLRSVSISPDNRFLLAGSQNPEERTGDLILWDLQTCQMVRRFETSGDVSSISFSRDGRRAITGTGYFSQITLWNVNTGKEIKHFELPEPGPILDLAFSPDGESVLGAGLDRLILWDIQSGEIARVYSGHAGMPWSLEISPDGKYIFSGSQLGEVIIWDYSTGEELYHSTSHASPIYSVAFSPDGRFAYSASEDGQIIQSRITEQSLDELLDWIKKNRFVRQLTCDERREYRVEPPCEP
jgi:WD40 repeat protein